MFEKEAASDEPSDTGLGNSALALYRYSPELSASFLGFDALGDYTKLMTEKSNHIAPLEYEAIEHTVRLRIEKEQDNAMLKYNPDAIVLLHPDLHIQQTNAAFHTLFACEPNGYLGCSLSDLICDTDIVHISAALQRASEQQTSQQVEIHCYAKNGTHFEAELSIGPIPIGAETTGFVCTIRDITKRNCTEAALRQALKKAEAVNDLKLRFIAMAAHELRAPLTTMLVMTDTLRMYRHQLADQRIEQRLSQMKVQIVALEGMIEDTLQLAQLQAHRTEFNPVEFNLDTLCRNILDEFQSQSAVTQRFLYICDSDLSTVKLDQMLIQRIITNLIANALKYSPLDKPIKISLSCLGEMLSLVVQDQGIGIPPAELHHIFEPFQRATNVGATKGTGLGLAIVKEAVDLHDGTITVVSELRVGTTFTVRIPLRRWDAKDHPSLLIIEDNIKCSMF